MSACNYWQFLTVLEQNKGSWSTKRFPSPKDIALDGMNFLPALENKALDRAKPLLWVYYSALNERRVAMRDGDWKVLAKLDIEKHVTVTTAE